MKEIEKKMIREELDERLAKFEFKGLSDELKDNGVFKPLLVV